MRRGARFRTRIALGSVAPVVLAAALAPAQATAAVEGLPPLGVTASNVSEFETQRMGTGGVEVLRTTFQWRHVQPRPGRTFDWSRYDRLMSRASRAGVAVLPIIIGSPNYVAKHPGKQPRGKVNLGRYSRFVTSLVNRYRPDGRFWRQNPLLTETPVTAWQVWNEPNLQQFWTGRLRPGAYVRFLALTRRAIHDADPGAGIVLAGMPETKKSLPMSRYLQGIYRQPGAKRLFDAVAAHAYAGGAKGVARTLEIQRRIMDRNGDRGTRLWVTEIGWASAGPASPLVKDREGQATLLTKTYKMLAKRPRRYRLGPIFWYDWRDGPRPPGAADHFSYHTGLFERDHDPKPAWRAFTEISGGQYGAGPIPPNSDDLPLVNLLPADGLP